MSHHAHGTNKVYGHASRTPLAHVRTVQQKRRPLGWMECSVDEFLRLLALHQAGKINLLKTPEYATDDIDDEPEDEQPVVEKPLGKARRSAASRVPGATCVLVRQTLAHSSDPMTSEQIARQTGATNNAVRTVLRRNPQWFACAGTEGQALLWVAKREGDNGS